MNSSYFELRKSVARLHYFLLNLLLCSSILAASQVRAQEAPDAFLRFVEGGGRWQGRLQTAITRYENSDGVEVELVAAVHIADPEYYARLNDHLATRQLVLYELVAEPEQRPSPGISAGGTSLIGLLQQAASRLLGMGFQLQHIDYTASNFRHADLNPAQLREIMRAKNETFFSMLIDLAVAQMAADKQAQERGQVSASLLNGRSVMLALAAEDSGRAIRYLLGRELARSGGQLLPPELEEQVTILADRNRVALSVLEQSLEDPTLRSISIFYGAAHMRGLELGLTERMGFERLDRRWFDAWVMQ